MFFDQSYRYSQIQARYMRTKQEIVDLQKKEEKLNDESTKVQSDIEEAKNKIEDSKTIIANTTGQIKNLQGIIRNVDNEIRQLRAIIDSQAPIPLYGNYCIHGHLNCVNCPNIIRQLENGAEIEAHKENVDEAQRKLREKIEQSRQLSSQLQDYINKKQAAEIAIKNNEGKLYTAKQRYENIKVDIKENKKWQEFKNQELDRILAEMAACEQQMSPNAQQGQPPQSLAPAALQQIAMQELAREQANNLARLNNVVDTESSNTHIDILADIARRELAEEESKAAQFSSPAPMPSPVSYPSYPNTNDQGVRINNAINDVSEASQNMAFNALQRIAQVSTGARSIWSNVTNNFNDLRHFAKDKVYPLINEISTAIDPNNPQSGPQ